MITPRWEPDFPADIRRIVEPVLVRWLDLVPTWCQEFRVRYRGDEQNTLKVNIHHSNRWAVLTITGAWLDEPESAREEAIIHELVHVAVEPLFTAADRAVEELSDEDSPVRRLASAGLREGLECSVDDLARGIQRLLKFRAA